MKDKFWKVWDKALNAVDVVANWVSWHPRITLLLIVVYVIVRR